LLEVQIGAGEVAAALTGPHHRNIERRGDMENTFEMFDELFKTVRAQALRIDELERRLAALEEESDFNAEISNLPSAEAEDRRALRLA
jgi:hypothetical protein